MDKSVDDHGMESNRNILAMPPHRSGEKFEDVYDVILILDDREQFAKNNRGSDPFCSNQFVDYIKMLIFDMFIYISSLYCLY